MNIPDKETQTFEISSESDRDKIISEVLAHAAIQEAQYRQPISDPAAPGRWKGPLALLVMVLAGVLAAFPPAWLRGAWPAPISDADLVTGYTATLQVHAEQLEAYRIRNGRLPPTLADIEHSDAAVRYVRSNNRVFQLVVTGPDGRNVVYDSARPASAFEAVTSGWNEGPAGS